MRFRERETRPLGIPRRQSGRLSGRLSGKKVLEGACRRLWVHEGAIFSVGDAPTSRRDAVSSTRDAVSGRADADTNFTEFLEGHESERRSALLFISLDCST